jgi:hypothetical protein
LEDCELRVGMQKKARRTLPNSAVACVAELG